MFKPSLTVGLAVTILTIGVTSTAYGTVKFWEHLDQIQVKK